VVASELSLARVEEIRSRLWRTHPSRQIRDERGALRFIRELGFALLMPITGAEVPSLAEAAGADWGIWWDWKQTLPGRKACYYSHILRSRGTFISWPWFPRFLAAYGDPRGHRQLYREGLLDRAEKEILDRLEHNGPMMTREIRLAVAPQSKENTRRVKAALVELQKRFLITAAGGDTEGWSHHRWELVERWVQPDLLAAGLRLPRQTARQELLFQCVRNLVATTAADLAWLLGWERPEVNLHLRALVSAGEVETVLVPELGGEVLVARSCLRRAGLAGKG